MGPAQSAQLKCIENSLIVTINLDTACQIVKVRLNMTLIHDTVLVFSGISVQCCDRTCNTDCLESPTNSINVINYLDTTVMDVQPVTVATPVNMFATLRVLITLAIKIQVAVTEVVPG